MSTFETIWGFFLALLTGLLSTLAVRFFARKWGIVNMPNAIIPQHTHPVAYLGGAGIAIAAIVTITTIIFFDWSPVSDIHLGLLLPSLIFLGLGILDDLRTLKPLPKFSLQAIAAVLAIAMGNQCSFTGIAILDHIISAIWILTLVNAFNLVDVCDGLTGGLGVIILLFLAYLMPDHSGLPLILAGACLGFLALNWPPATIFLGDAGSHLLGFVIASLTLTWMQTDGLWPQLAQVALLVWVPLFELVFLTSVRLRKGIPWWQGSPDHFSLRLQQAGLSRLQTDLIAWGIAVLVALVALSLESLSLPAQGMLLLGVTLVHLKFASLLLKWEVCTS